jgi:hypothetical protein
MWPFSNQARHHTSHLDKRGDKKLEIRNHLQRPSRTHPIPSTQLIETLQTAQQELEYLQNIDVIAVKDLITECKTFQKTLSTFINPLHGTDVQSLDVYNGNIEDAYTRLKNTVGQSPDINIRRFYFGRVHPTPALLAFENGLASNQMVDQDILRLMQRFEDTERLSMEDPVIHQWVHDMVAAVGHITVEKQWSQLLIDVMGGNTLVFIEGASEVLVMDTVSYPARAIERAETERSVTGPQEAFNEVGLTQMNLIRRRIKSPRLHFDLITTGDLTQTMVLVAHIEGITNPAIVLAVKRRLTTLKISGLQYSHALEPFLTDQRSLFPQVRSTERVDIIVRDLLQGKVAILVDNDPFVLAVPATFMDFYQTSDDYTASFWTGSMERMVRLFGLFVGLLLPPLYIAFVTVNPELLPLKFVMSIAGSRLDIPFPPLLEVLIMWVIIEVLREAAIRLPKALSNTLGTVGAIVVGTAIVKAGLVDNLMIIIITLTALGLFTSPEYVMATPWRILFWILVFSSYLFGLYGIVVALMMILGYLARMENFGVPYLSPFGPIRWRDLKDSWVKWPETALKYRPSALRTIHPRQIANAPHPSRALHLHRVQKERRSYE